MVNADSNCILSDNFEIEKKKLDADELYLHMLKTAYGLNNINIPRRFINDSRARRVLERTKMWEFWSYIKAYADKESSQNLSRLIKKRGISDEMKWPIYRWKKGKTRYIKVKGLESLKLVLFQANYQEMTRYLNLSERIIQKYLKAFLELGLIKLIHSPRRQPKIYAIGVWVPVYIKNTDPKTNKKNPVKRYPDMPIYFLNDKSLSVVRRFKTRLGDKKRNPQTNQKMSLQTNHAVPGNIDE